MAAKQKPDEPTWEELIQKATDYKIEIDPYVKLKAANPKAAQVALTRTVKDHEKTFHSEGAEEGRAIEAFLTDTFIAEEWKDVTITASVKEGEWTATVRKNDPSKPKKTGKSLTGKCVHPETGADLFGGKVFDSLTRACIHYGEVNNRRVDTSKAFNPTAYAKGKFNFVKVESESDAQLAVTSTTGDA